MSRALPSITVECPAPDCRGGLWRGRPGRECFVCRGAGDVEVVAKPNGLGGGCSFHVRTPKGTVTKPRFEFEAKLAAPLRRYNSGATVGGGHYCTYSNTNEVGARCGVYAIVNGKLVAQLPGGGFASEGQELGATGDDDHPHRTVEIEIPDPAVAEWIESLREFGRTEAAAS